MEFMNLTFSQIQQWKFFVKFDLFMAEHLRLYGEQGSGNMIYLLKTTYEEFNVLMAGKDKKIIIN